LNVQFNDLTFSQQDGFTHIKINNTNFDIKISELINLTRDDFIFSATTTPVEPIPPVIPPVVTNPTPVPPSNNSNTVTGTEQNDTLSVALYSIIISSD